MDNKKIGARIKSERKLLKMTQSQLADHIHKKEITVRKYENGEITIPLDVLNELAKVFNIKLYDLMYDTQTLAIEVKEWEIIENLFKLYGYDLDFLPSGAGVSSISQEDALEKEIENSEIAEKYANEFLKEFQNMVGYMYHKYSSNEQ